MIKNLKIKIIIALIALFLPFISSAAEPVPLAGINVFSPVNFKVLGDTLYFNARYSITGAELWKSDGTASGTAMVKDIRPGLNASSNPSNFTSFNGVLYFAADDGIHGDELWKSDGTASGTVMVKDLVIGSNSGNPSNLIIYHDKLYFIVDAYNQIWQSDGTEAGTVLLDLGPYSLYSSIDSGGPKSLGIFQDKLIFFASYFDEVSIDSSYFLITTDGTLAGLSTIKDFTEFNGGGEFVTYNNQVFFQANVGSNGTELWRSDGTASGTVMVKDIRSGSASSNPTNLIAMDNGVYFLANDGINGIELWQTDGTATGTVMLKDIYAGSQGSANGQVASNGTLYFSSLKNKPLLYENKIYFAANDGINGGELWVSDGTPDGTVLFKDITPGPTGSSPADLTLFKNQWYFVANNKIMTLDLVLPTKPVIQTGLINSDSQAAVTWTAATDNVAVVKYYIYRNGIKHAETTNINYLDSAIIKGATYSYQVSAVDSSGNESPLSEAVSITIPYPVVVNSVNIPPPAPIISIPAPITITPTAGSQGILSVSGVSNAKYIAVSSRPDFSQSSWVLYTDTYKLSDKTKGKVYVKFRSGEGGETAPVEVAIPNSNSINQPVNTNQPVIAPIKPLVAKPTPKPQVQLVKPATLTVNLAPGSRHEQVKLLQQVLVKQGLLKAQDITSTYGPKTIKAVKTLQKKNNLPQTGTVGPLTRKVLEKK